MDALQIIHGLQTLIGDLAAQVEAQIGEFEKLSRYDVDRRVANPFQIDKVQVAQFRAVLGNTYYPLIGNVGLRLELERL